MKNGGLILLRFRGSPALCVEVRMICAYQSRRIMGMRKTAPMDKGAGSSGSSTGEAADGLVETAVIVIDEQKSLAKASSLS